MFDAFTLIAPLHGPDQATQLTVGAIFRAWLDALKGIGDNVTNVKREGWVPHPMLAQPQNPISSQKPKSNILKHNNTSERTSNQNIPTKKHINVTPIPIIKKLLIAAAAVQKKGDKMPKETAHLLKEIQDRSQSLKAHRRL